MKMVLTIFIVCISAFGEYQKAKIDMHGGKSYNKFGSKSSGFGKSGMGMSALVDTNASTKTKRVETKK